MKFTIAATLLAVFATSAIADNCNIGLVYCGSSLLKKGNYQGQIDQALHAANKPSINNGRQDLFKCLGGASGIITWVAHCNSECYDAGQGQSDFCV